MLWRAQCKPCQALLTDREATRRNPLLSSFTLHLYEAYALPPKPVPATAVANAIDTRTPLLHLDIRRCRASIVRETVWEWVAASAAGELVQATPASASLLDFILVRGP